MGKTAIEHLAVDIAPGTMDLPILETGTPELETTVPETTTTNAVEDLLHLEGTQERPTEIEIAITTNRLATIVEAEAEVRDEIVRHIMADRQVEK